MSATENFPRLPKWTLLLGYGGLIPFLGLAWLTASPQLDHTAVEFATWNLQYGLAIISFLGAIHWGLALAESDREQPYHGRPLDWLWGVTPCLAAWFAIVFLDLKPALWTLCAILLAVWCFDQARLGGQSKLRHYLTLRTHLTLGAALGLGATAYLL